MTTQDDERKKQREGYILFAIFGTLVVLLIGFMWFIDYYAESKDPFAAVRAKPADD